MDGHQEQTHYVKRVVLPSGKTIEVVYFTDGSSPVPVDAAVSDGSRPVAEPHQALHVCGECASELVHPLDWEEAGPENWTVTLRCPNCEHLREGIFSQETVEAFDEHLDDGAEALARDYRRLMRANLADEIERFAGALAVDAVLPEDF
jgi:hypothetical protein